MLVTNIIIFPEYLEELNKFKIDNLFLINIYNDGICVTQNINDISNFSIFIKKNMFVEFEVKEENSFVTNDINSLNKILIHKNYDNYTINGNVSIVNKSCNVCRLLKNLEFESIDNNDIEIDDKLHFLNKNKFSICNSNILNGIVLKTNMKNFILYINILVENNKNI